MSAGRAWVFGLMASAALTVFALAPARAQAPAGSPQVAPTHEVRRGDTLFGIARKVKYERVSRNQMIVALYRANQNAFPGGNINVLEVGTVLVIPALAVVVSIEPAEADRLVRELLAKWAAAPAAPAAAPSAKPAPGAKAPAVAPPGREEAARRYRDGLAMERRGDEQGALKAFLEAGEAGFGPAQRKLGQIYDKGNSVAPRDYQAALKWYQKARDQGIDVGKPLPRMPPK